MQDVLVLLQHLTENEETTIKLIIECLYDVGAVNFINKKVQNDSINQFTKTLAGMSKPIAKRYGYYWFKKNCPELIVNWLTRKVAFPTPKAKTVQPQETAPKVDPAPISTDKAFPADQTPPSQLDETSIPEESATSAGTAILQGKAPGISIAPMNGATDRQEDQPQVIASSADGLQAEPQSSGSENAVDQHPPNSPTYGTDTTPNKAAEPEVASGSINPLISAESAAPSEPEFPIENQPSSDTLPTSMEKNITQTRPLKTQNKVLMESFKVTALPTPMEQKTTQIRRLKTQNKVLLGSLAGTILAGGLAIWQLHATQQSALQLHQSTPSSIVPASQSVK